MRIIERFRRARSTSRDPVFGELEYESRWRSWKGSYVLRTTQKEVQLRIVADAVEARHRELVAELDTRYEALAPQIAAALFALSGGPCAELDAACGIAVESADQIWTLTVLESIDVAADNSFKLGYAFKDSVEWPDAMFSVIVRDWQAKGEFFAD